MAEVSKTDTGMQLKRILGALETNEVALSQVELIPTQQATGIERESIMQAVASTRDARERLNFARSALVARIG